MVDAEPSPRPGEDEVPTLPAWVTGPERPSMPTRIGRFTVVARVGAGGAGEVFSALDDTLQRPVALKLVRRGRVSAEQETRLLREAHALAKLSHPNVVAVHDADRTDDFVYIAMELVEGGTLKEAFADPSRDAAQRVSLLLQAARGLHAAHALGLVHRDFKPANALVGLDGRVRVADFGLARLAASHPDSVGDCVAPENLSADFSDLTATGAILGTPAYMSPEQRLGQAITAASDQFSFCVVAWQALYGVHPLADLDLAAWVAGEADIADPPSSAGISTPLETALRRGLEPEPEQRHASMDPVIEALQAELRPRRQGRALTVLLLVAVVLGFASWMALREREEPCSAITLHWAAAHDAALLGAFDAPSPATRAEARFVIARMNEAAAKWTADARTACREQTPAAQRCLDERRASLETAGEVFMGNSHAARSAAPEIIGTLQGPCHPRSGASEHADLRREIAQLRTRLAAGESHFVAERAQRLADRSSRAPTPATLGALLALRGTALAKAGDPTAAVEALRLAYNQFERSGATSDSARIASELAVLTAVDLQAPDRGHAWLRFAEQAASLVRKTAPDVSGDVAVARGKLALAGERWSAASDEFSNAAELLAADSSGDAPAQAWLLAAEAFEADGNTARATTAAGHATRHREDLFGADHPRTVAARSVQSRLRKAAEP